MKRILIGFFVGLVAISIVGLSTCKDPVNVSCSHVWEWVETKTPTATEDGEETYTCLLCGQTGAKRLVPAVPNVITTVNVNIAAPVNGVMPNTYANSTGTGYTLGAVSWTPNDNPFLGSTAYTASITLTANNGYTFAELNSAIINGQAATISNNTGLTATLSYIFPATPVKTVTDIEIKAQPNILTYTHGEPLNLTGLIVTFIYDDTTTEDVNAADFAGKQITSVPAHGDILSYTLNNNNPVAVAYGELTPLYSDNLTINKKTITNAELIITAPVKSSIPSTTAIGEGNFIIGDVTWSPYDSTFLGSKIYTATVTLTASNGYTFTGISIKTINGIDAIVSDNTGETITLSNTFAETDEREVSDFTVKTQPISLTYTHKNTLDLSGLIVTLMYDDFTLEDVAFDNFAEKNITADPAHGNTLIHSAHNNNPVTITYGDLLETATDELIVNPKITTFIVDSIEPRTYSGIAHTPTVTVKDEETILELGTDYTVSYANNIIAGTATVTVNGIGNYAGSTGSAVFTILQTVSPDRLEYYWVDAHGSLVTTSGNVVNITVGETLTITAQGTGYVVQQWRLNGVNTGQSGIAYPFTTTTPGKHTVGLFVEKGGKLYNTNIIITAGTPPLTPASVTAAAVSYSSITVNWSSVPDATGYRVYRSSTSAGIYTLRDTVSSTMYTDTGLSENTTYFYKITACNSYGESTQSDSASATTMQMPLPTAPTGVTANALSPFSATVRWDSVLYATSYRVYRSTSTSGTYTQIGTTTTTSYTNTGLTSDTTYYYRVSANNSSGESSQSNYTSVTPTGIQMIQNVPANGNTGTGEQWFRFTANASTQYFHISSGLTGVSAELYNNSGNQLGNSTNASGNRQFWWNNGTTSGQVYYIRIFQENSSASGTFLITYNSSGTWPF